MKPKNQAGKQPDNGAKQKPVTPSRGSGPDDRGGGQQSGSTGADALPSRQSGAPGSGSPQRQGDTPDTAAQRQGATGTRGMGGDLERDDTSGMGSLGNRQSQAGGMAGGASEQTGPVAGEPIQEASQDSSRSLNQQGTPGTNPKVASEQRGAGQAQRGSNELAGGMPRSPAGSRQSAGEKMDEDTGLSNTANRRDEQAGSQSGSSNRNRSGLSDTDSDTLNS